MINVITSQVDIMENCCTISGHSTETTLNIIIIIITVIIIIIIFII